MDRAADFVQRFAAFWADPAPEKLHILLTDDVVLVQPMERTTHGLPEAEALFRRLFTRMPDVRAQVDDWGARADEVFIAFRLAGTLGRQHVQWRAVDHFTLRGDKASHRVSHFDALPLALRMLRSPRAMVRWLRTA